MTGGAGTGAVGGDIVLGAFDLGPVRHDVTGAAKLARIIGEVSGADFYRMSEIAMAGPLIGVAIQTADLGAVQPLTNGCQNNCFVKERAAVVVADGTGCYLDHTVQCVDVSRAGQGAGACSQGLVWQLAQVLSMTRLLCAVAVAWSEARFSWQVSQVSVLLAQSG